MLLSPGLRPITGADPAPSNATLQISATSVNLSRMFLGTTVNNEVRMFRGETNAVNATPARVLVWPGGLAGEDYDPLTDTHYNSYNGTPSHALTNESQFVQLCLAIHCTAIVQVPAEIDDPSVAEKIVNFTERNLSFHPAYWMIGNEPELWYKWQVPWKDWETQSTVGPDPTQFGQEVLAYVAAIRAVDNTTPILGLPASGCSCGPGGFTFDQWIAGVLNVTGPKIQAVSFHEYPAGWLGTGDGSLQTFYGTIRGAASIPVRMAAARLAVQTACPGCNVSIFISELGSALSWSSYGQYALGFSGALSIASQLTQAMDVNLSNVDLFATELATKNSWFDPMGHARPDFTLYTGILKHLGTETFAVNVTGSSHDVYGIDTIAPNDRDRRDLMVVNDNITHAITFAPQFAESSGTGPVLVRSWNGSIHSTSGNHTTWVEPFTPTPIPQAFPEGLPATYTVPPQSIVLFEAYPSGGTYVTVVESGVPSPTPWYASIGSQFYTTTAGNISLLLPTGSYPVGSVGIPLPFGGKERSPVERLGPYVASPFSVNGTYKNITVEFTDQWQVNVSASPAEGGTAGPEVGWWNASEPLNLTVSSNPGYAFDRWSGWGPGSYNGTNRSISLVPKGRIVEKALFVVGEEVDLWESGLPADTAWSVTVRGLTSRSSTDLITFYEPLGSYGFEVNPVAGYRSVPRNGGFTVDGALRYVDLHFIPLTPPPPTFPVTFRISGVPYATPVSITVRDATKTTGEFYPQFQLLNGSYAYHVGYIAGYHPDVRQRTFVVGGGPLTIDVPFVPTVYPATWVANGYRAGMSWSVELNGRPITATSAWVSSPLPNGSYSYRIVLPSNFSANPRTGTFVIAGAAPNLYLVFGPVQFPVRFQATGPGAANPWTIRLGNLTQSVSENQSAFMSANGTYTFDVHPPAGYYAVPSHGKLTVAGALPPTKIQLHPSSGRPSAALVAALSSSALSMALWIGVSIFAGFVLSSGFRRWAR